MKTVAGLVVLVSVGIVHGLSIEVGIGVNSDFSAGPCNLQTGTNSEASETFDKTACDSPSAPDSPEAPDNPEAPCEFFRICQIK